MEKTTDRRAARTKKELKQAMLELLKKKDISKITVSELAERADIGRGTFYLHYADPYDLLDKLEDELLGEIMSSTTAAVGGQWEDILLHIEKTWRYIYDHQQQFSILLKHQGGMRFMRKFKEYCEQDALRATNRKSFTGDEASYEVIYIISGMLGLFQRWMEDGASIPPERLAEIARNILWHKI